MSRSNKFYDKLIIVCAAKQEKRNDRNENCYLQMKGEWNIFLNEEINRIKSSTKKSSFLLRASLIFLLQKNKIAGFVSYLFHFLQRFICSHTEQDAYHLIHLLFITLLKVLKSIGFGFCVLVLFFSKPFLPRNALSYTNSGFVRNSTAILQLIAFVIEMNIQDILIALAYVNALFPCFWDIRIIKWTLSLINLTIGI